MTIMRVTDRPHSRVSPSSFARFEVCSASYWLGAQAPPRETSTYALLGTALHHVFEHCVRGDLEVYELGMLDGVDVDGERVPVDGGDLELVQKALDWVRNTSLLRDRRVEVEQTLPLDFAAQHLGEPMFGYADLLARERFPVVVVDLKTGSQPIAADSAQLAIYLLAAVLGVTVGSLDDRDGPAGVTVVLQPGVGDDVADEHEWTWEALRDVRDRVIATLRKLKRGVFEYQVSEACRWCPALPTCPHLSATARDAALARVVPTPELVASGELTAERLGEMLDEAAVLDHKIRALRRVAEDYALHGGAIPGWKLVRKRSNRRWRDEERAPEALRALGIDPDDVKLVTPAEAERRAAPTVKAAVGALAEKPEAGLSLAPVDDRRPAVEVAARLRAALHTMKASTLLASNRGR